MELRVLEYFLALTQEGSISAAAKALNVSQPTLSRQLMDLEKELGCVLFERSKQGIILTDDGRTVGYSVEGSIDETMAEIKKHLEEKGWSYVPSGQESVATFAKDTGTFCWLAVTCASVEAETSVVLVYEENPVNQATE